VRNHEAAVHEKIKQFQCKECNLRFSQHSNLISHTKFVHRNIKQHKCLLCEKYYKRKRLLSYHLQSAHNIGNNQRLKCTEVDCNFSTIYHSHLISHRKSHNKFSDLAGSKDKTLAIDGKA
jgi:Zinc finger, C2H2 type